MAMSPFRSLRHLWTFLTRRAAHERDLDEEVRGFADELTARRVKSGMDPAEARRSALAEMGGIEAVKAQARDARVGVAVDLWLKDLVFAWRAVRRNAAFSAGVVLTLGIGIAAATTLFTQANAVLFKTLPVDEPWQLRELSWTSPDLSFAGPSNERFWRTQVAAGHTITAFSYHAYQLVRDGVAGLAGCCW